MSDPTTVYVVMSNDYPDRVFFSLEKAEAYAKEKNDEQKQIALQDWIERFGKAPENYTPIGRIYYSPHEVEAEA